MTDGPADERCEECGRLDPSNCPCPPARQEVTRRRALLLAVDVLERSDWLLSDLLADEGDEHYAENSDAVVALLRQMADEQAQPKPPRPTGLHQCTTHTYDEAARRWVCAYVDCPHEKERRDR